jgi:hypothetical protein
MHLSKVCPHQFLPGILSQDVQGTWAAHLGWDSSMKCSWNIICLVLNCISLSCPQLVCKDIRHVTFCGCYMLWNLKWECISSQFLPGILSQDVQGTWAAHLGWDLFDEMLLEHCLSCPQLYLTVMFTINMQGYQTCDFLWMLYVMELEVRVRKLTILTSRKVQVLLISHINP